MRITYDPQFLRKLKKANVRIRNNAKKRLLVFSRNPNDPQLNNHVLKDEYLGHRSIDVTGNWRAIYKELRQGDKTIAYFVALGTHIELYRRRRTS